MLSSGAPVESQGEAVGCLSSQGILTEPGIVQVVVVAPPLAGRQLYSPALLK